MSSLPDPEAWKSWSPAAQRRAMDLIHAQSSRPWRPFFCPDPLCSGKPHGGPWNHPHARPDQRPPPWRGEWLTWLLRSGRGAGKTETGSRVTHEVIRKVPRVILVAPTGPDLRETMIEGISGILATAKPGERPLWEPSKKKLTWPNGAIGQGFSAEEPDRLRGPQSGFIWMDEPAHYDSIETVWDNALFGLRLKSEWPCHVVATTTPKPNKWMKAIVKDPLTVVSRASTYENLDNLDESYRRIVIAKYEGTRLGKQELHGELLEDVVGALWESDMISYLPPGLLDAMEMETVVVAVDPAGTADRRSDETGIVVVGWAKERAIVLEDLTGKYTPKGWGDRAWAAHEKWSADRIIAEKNYGGEMVRHVLDTSSEKLAKVKLVNSRRGKALRAEPVVAQYEKGNVMHAEGLADLEEEMLSWVPGEGHSPNRVDALVHGLTDLFRTHAPSSIARPGDVLKHQRRDPGDIPPQRRFPWQR